MAVAVRFEYEGAGRSRRKMRMIELILKASGGEGSRSVIVPPDHDRANWMKDLLELRADTCAFG